MSTKKEIRKLEPEALEEALALVWEVFAEFEAPDYSQEGIEEFWRFIDLEYMIMQQGEGNLTFGEYVSSFLSVLVNFVITAFVLFLIIKTINQLMSIGKKPEEPKAPTTKKCPFCKTDVAIDATRCPHCTSMLEE